MVTLGGPFLNHILGMLLVFLRVGSFWMFFPVFGEKNVPAMIRLLGGVALSMAMYPFVSKYIPGWRIEALPGDSEIVTVVLREIFIGISLGYVARAVFWAVTAGAEWLSVQIGFSIASIVDPSSGQGGAGWGEFHRWLAFMLFLAIGGHVLLLEGIAQTYKMDMTHVFDVMIMQKKSALYWIELTEMVLVWIIKLTGPIVIVILMIQVAFGVLSKFIPQINVFSVSIPLTLLVGLFSFTVLSPMYGDAFNGVFGEGMNYFHHWIKLLGAR